MKEKWGWWNPQEERGQMRRLKKKQDAKYGAMYECKRGKEAFQG